MCGGVCAFGGSAGGCEGGLAPHWLSMGAHTTTLPVLISAHAGEQWHRAGGLLEKQERPPHHPPPTLTPSLHTPTHSSVWTYVSIWACGSRAHKGKVCLSVYRFLFCVDDAKINCDLENEQQQERMFCYFMSAMEALFLL